MIFHAFDVSADGNVEAKEFIYILAKIANVKTDPEELLKSKKSGLVKYLFGEDLSGELTSETFKNLQTRLIDDVLSLEFTRLDQLMNIQHLNILVQVLQCRGEHE